MQKYDIKISFPQNSFQELINQNYDFFVFNVFEESKENLFHFLKENYSFSCFKKEYNSFKAKKGEKLYLSDGFSKHFLFIGLGSSKLFLKGDLPFENYLEENPYTLDIFRAFISQAILKISKLPYNKKKILFILNGFDLNLEFDFVRHIVESSYIGTYSFDIFKSDKGSSSETIETIESVDFYFSNESKEINQTNDIYKKYNAQHIEKSILDGYAVAQSVDLCRDFIQTPSNLCTPKDFVNKIIEEKKDLDNLSIKIFKKEEIESLKMQSFLAVAKGSIEEPYFLTLHYKPKLTKTKEVLGILGKGITFDTGGISLKPSQNMHEMKGDMSGAAVVASSILAAAKMNLPIEVKAYIPLCENMPSGSAVKPGDIVKAMNGKTIEILNTDAEGRLILADALSYASQKSEGNTMLIDVATLTGACVVALGELTTGVFSNNVFMQKKFLKASHLSGERSWPLPLFADYHELIKSSIADIANIGKRGAGAITAAAFLENFVNNTPWIHLDIAGTNWVSGTHSHSLYPIGPTGAMVSSLLTFMKLLAFEE